MTRYIMILLTAFAPLILTGCGISPPYAFAEGEARATVELMGYGTTTLCKEDDAFYKPVKIEGDADRVHVPAGERLTLSRYMYFDMYNVVYTCEAGLSFVPEPDQHYVVNADLTTEGCFTEVVKADPGSRTGVQLEESVQRQHCY